jgi:hypothetical protein
MTELADVSYDVTVPVPAHLFKGWQRGAETTITVADTVTGHGSSRKAATLDAAVQVVSTLESLNARPAIVREPDGSMWFFYAHREGTEYRRMGPDGQVTGCVSVTGGTPAEKADQIVENHAGAVRVL